MDWQVATLIESKMVAEDVKSLTFSLQNWIPHKSGQHYDIRLTSEDGYVAERSYSIASAPEKLGVIEFGIQLLQDGEVSPYLFSLQPGEQVEVRGPIGGYFNWEHTDPKPLVLIAGGSGAVPLMSMLLHYQNHGKQQQVVFIISAKSYGHMLYKDELAKIAGQETSVKIVYTLTREVPDGWSGHTGRIDKILLQQYLSQYIHQPVNIYLCGATSFVEDIGNLLLGIGFEPEVIKTERFG
jgi:ferredoxin-NADP reductase